LGRRREYRLDTSRSGVARAFRPAGRCPQRRQGHNENASAQLPVAKDAISAVQ
jgi:hypothetical protein